MGAKEDIQKGVIEGVMKALQTADAPGVSDLQYVPGPFKSETHCMAEHSGPATAPDAVATIYACAKAPGHNGAHGHPGFGEWFNASVDDSVFPPVKGVTLDEVYIDGVPVGVGDIDFSHSHWSAEAGKPEARVEIVIASGAKAKPQKLRINGWEVPNVKDVTVEYSSDDTRIVIVEIRATDLIEVTE